MTAQDMLRFPARPVTLKNETHATVRCLSPADGPAMVLFYAGVPRADLRHYGPHLLDREHALAVAAETLSPCRVTLVLELPDASIGGYAWYRWADASAGTSTFGICISRACQGQGAGRALMKRLLEIAPTVGPPVMSLTVQLANARAVALYRDMGFEVVREQMTGPNHLYGFPPEPEYYMERQVR